MATSLSLGGIYAEFDAYHREQRNEGCYHTDRVTFTTKTELTHRRQWHTQSNSVQVLSQRPLQRFVRWLLLTPIFRLTHLIRMTLSRFTRALSPNGHLLPNIPYFVRVILIPDRTLTLLISNHPRLHRGTLVARRPLAKRTTTTTRSPLFLMIRTGDFGIDRLTFNRTCLTLGVPRALSHDLLNFFNRFSRKHRAPNSTLNRNQLATNH